MWWTDPIFGKPVPRRIVGIAADVDDEHVVRGPALTIYHPVQQMRVAGRLFVRADGDPYALVPAVARLVQEMSPNQPVERAATLEDVRAEVLAPDRLNALVLAGFAGIALLIAVVGVAGVLAFSVSARLREFGVRLAVGSSPRHLLLRVLLEGAVIVAIGIAAGAAGGFAFAGIASAYFENVRLPGALPVVGAAVVLVGAALLASLMPAARASRVDVLQALRSE
jgi:predicted lysophospholipase L1 biosynthesis ABC-type transport system permease subunit